MAAREFNANVRQQDGKTIIDLNGEINGLVEADLNEAYTIAESTESKTIVLNFSDVEYINSTGIALIVGLLAQARKNQRRLVVFGLSDHYTEIFTITRLADFMTIFPDEVTAISS